MKQYAVVLIGMVVLATRVDGQAVRRKCNAEFPHQATACIVAPAEGSTLHSPSVRVVLQSKGIDIAPVAAGKAGAAHFHVFLDVDASPSDAAIPQGPGITHMGDGKKELRLENVAPGAHRVIVVLGDNSHVPVKGQKADTLYFQVAAK